MVANDIEPGAITAARFLIGATVMGTLLFISKNLKKEDFKKPWRFFILGLSIVIYFVLMFEALKTLKPRENEIICKRRLSENPKTLEQLSQEYKVSRERIRQIETRAFEKLQTLVKSKAKEFKLIESNEN